jgi:lysylphosphatidylglycerol synthetase-like protein (DUF2156 family)
MPNITIGFGAVLCALGLFGYFRSAAESPSLTALIPFFVGAVLILFGAVARIESVRKHAMHAAAVVGLLGFLAGTGRGFMNIGNVISDDPTLHRGPRLAVLMGLVCLVFVCVCVASFISARRRRKADPAS